MTVAPNPARDFVPHLFDSSEIEEPGHRTGLARGHLFSVPQIPLFCHMQLLSDRCRERAINSLKPKSQAVAAPKVEVLGSSQRYRAK